MVNTTAITVWPTATGMSSMTKATLPNKIRDKTTDKRPILSSRTDMANQTRAMLKVVRKTMVLKIDNTTHGINKNQTEVDITLKTVKECKDRHSRREIRIIEDARLRLRGKTHGMVILGLALTTHLSRKIDAKWSLEMAMGTDGTLESQS
jgi:hypothetical protein